MTKREQEFKLEFSGKEEITRNAGLGLYGQMYRSVGVETAVEGSFCRPGSGNGYEANEYIKPLVLMFLGGGRYIEDIRQIGADKGLCRMSKISKIPSADAVGDWLGRGWRKKISNLKEVHDNLSISVVRKSEGEMTLDIDATEIIAWKREAAITYKFNKGYMPMLGFIAELGLCVGYEFREGNEPPNVRNYEFAKGVIEFIEGIGKQVDKFRSDSAAYIGKLMNYLNKKTISYTITVDQDIAVKEAIKKIPDEAWERLIDKDGFKTDREYVEFVHSMNSTDHSFRVVVQRWLNPQMDLLKDTEKYCYHGIASNFPCEEKPSKEVIYWHNGRSNSENYNKEIKSGFNLEYMPSGSFGANAVWFGVGLLAYNLFIASKIFLFPKSWLKKTIGTIRWQFICMAGKVIRHSRRLILRICSTLRETFDIYVAARQRCWELAEIT